MTADTFSGLKFRSIGPAVASGRVMSIAVNPKNKFEYYVGVASGGVWKTVNDGTTWTPVFDGEGSYSIGWVALDPNDSSVVWVGSGESNSQRSVSYGDGIYRSVDGGKSWENLGLKKSEHIGRVVVDPRDSKVVYVAAEGPLWGPGGDRGLYKSMDGGKNWKAVLTISENTGVVDVALDPSNPDIVYAAAYQRRRHVFTLIDGGPESAIYKSTDAGATWNKLKSGLPSVDMGRIGLAVSPADPNVVYATIEAADGKGGIFRSSDKGATWERRNEFDLGAMYYARVVADPKNVDRIFVMIGAVARVARWRQDAAQGERGRIITGTITPSGSIRTTRSTGCWGPMAACMRPGTMRRAGNSRRICRRCSFMTWRWTTRRPFYNVCGGTQDYFSWCGPSRTRESQRDREFGLVRDHRRRWVSVAGGSGGCEHDLFRVAVWRAGAVRQADGAGTGACSRSRARASLRCGGIGIRRIIISPHSHTRLYFAANKLFRSDDRGDTWKAISGDLTRQIDRNKLAGDGKGVGSGCGGEESVDFVLREHCGAGGVSEKRRADLCGHRRWADSGDERRRRELDEV